MEIGGGEVLPNPPLPLVVDVKWDNNLIAGVAACSNII